MPRPTLPFLQQTFCPMPFLSLVAALIGIQLIFLGPYVLSS